MRDLWKFLDWKKNLLPQEFSPIDLKMLDDKKLIGFYLLSKRSCWYNKTIIRKFTEFLWQESVNNKFRLEGDNRVPTVSYSNLVIPKAASREEEVILMSLFYKNNLLNKFLNTTQKELCASALCICEVEEQSAFHVLTNCTLVDETLRNVIISRLLYANDIADSNNLIADHISVLDCSRDEIFISKALEVIRNKNLKLRTKIKLVKRTRAVINEPEVQDMENN